MSPLSFITTVLVLAAAPAAPDAASPAASEGDTRSAARFESIESLPTGDTPLDGSTRLEPPSSLRSGGDVPLDGFARQEATSSLPSEGATPLASRGGSAPASAEEAPAVATPLERAPAAGHVWIAKPMGIGPRPPEPIPLNPRRQRMVRVDLMLGTVWRPRVTEVEFSTSVEYGRMSGFSGVFHLGAIIAPDTNFVGVVEVPIGVGAIARGRLRKRPLYGSIGLTAGVLVHRGTSNPDNNFGEPSASSDDSQVIHRVDPDFRVPIRFAWTVSTVGVSLAVVQGWSVRTRSYERRGVTVWSRSPYRVGLLLGLHFDLMAGRARARAGRPGKKGTS